VQDLPKEVRRFASFLEVELNDEEVKKIAEKCLFTSMKKTTVEGNTDLDKLRGHIGVLKKGKHF